MEGKKERVREKAEISIVTKSVENRYLKDDIVSQHLLGRKGKKK